MPANNSLAVVFDIDGVVRDVSHSYRRALADTVEQFTQGAYRPSQEDIDVLKTEGIWNNDWEASQELVYRYFEQQSTPPEGVREWLAIDYDALVAFFQTRYRGTDPVNWNGYICQEPLLMQPAYLESLTAAEIAWGFFSGATTGSARYVLEKRLGLQAPVLVAMEDAPGKPNPTGLLQTLERLNCESITTVVYVGDTVADMYTVDNARQLQPRRNWLGVGVLPPHAQDTPDHASAYRQNLLRAGAAIVLNNVEELTPQKLADLVATKLDMA